jgi:hypothetical protein
MLEAAMKQSLNLLNDIRVASPCSVPWNQMNGDDRSRHCSQCNQAVYDISALTADEAADLLASHGDVCVRLYRREDGTVMTQNCPARMVSWVRWAMVQVGVVAACLFGFALVTGGTSESSRTDAPDESRRTQGKVCVPSREFNEHSDARADPGDK